MTPGMTGGNPSPREAEGMSELEVHGDLICGCGTCRECTERERAEKAEAKQEEIRLAYMSTTKYERVKREQAEAQRDRIRSALADLLAAIGGVSYDGPLDAVEETDEARRVAEEVLAAENRQSLGPRRPMSIIEVGQQWKRRNGERIQITSVDRERQLVSWRSLDNTSSVLTGWQSLFRDYRLQP